MIKIVDLMLESMADVDMREDRGIGYILQRETTGKNKHIESYQISHESLYIMYKDWRDFMDGLWVISHPTVGLGGLKQRIFM